MCEPRQWKSEYQGEYVPPTDNSRGARRQAQTRTLLTPPAQRPPAPSVVGAVARSRRAESSAAVPPENPLDRTRTEYTTAFIEHGPGISGDLIKHPDHDDIFKWQKRKTPKSTSACGHCVDATVHNPNYVQTRDYGYERPEPDITRFQRLEQIVDVNPLKPQHRLNAGKPESTYRTYFRSFFPGQPDARYGLSSKGVTFLEPSRPATAQERGLVNDFPFDIESRKLLGVKDSIGSTYRRDYIDFANPPVEKGERRPQTAASTPSWEGYRPDKVQETELNPFDFAVRGPVSSNHSTIYRDNYVDFIDRQTMRTLDD